MKKVFLILSSVLILPLTCLSQDNNLSKFTGEFRGLEGTITYTTEAGNVVTEPCVNVIGRFSRDADSFKITISLTNPDASVEDIPTACLAREHWWTSFELLMKTQREYAQCVEAIKENQLRVGDNCLIDDLSCSPIAFIVLVIREYWVPHSIVINAVDKTKPPRKRDYLDHFVAGISSQNLAIQHRDLCRSSLDSWRARR